MSEENKIIDFEIPKLSPSIIMVTGVGGGGSNAVNHMYELEIADVSFMVCNTDPQALRNSPVPVKVRLGQNGLGAGNNPEKGRQAALESLDEIIEIYKREGTKMVFITAGMGGGTGTGAAPVIARAAKEMGILTVAIVTIPFKTEGPKRMRQAYQGIDELRGCVDSLLLINNENIQEIFGKLTLTEAFGKADDILATAAKGIAEVITRENTVNVDFADVQTVMTDSGVALMGSGRASGEDRAMKVANMALESPLLNHNDIAGAKNILINITSGDEEITLEETYMITEYIQERAGNNADIIWGAGKDDSLGTDIEVTIIATGLLVGAALEAAELLSSEGISAAVINMASIKPIDRDIIVNAAKSTGCLVTAEEHNIIGGLGSAVTEVICETVPVPVIRCGVEDVFGHSGPALKLLDIFGLNAKGIVSKAKAAIAL